MTNLIIAFRNVSKVFEDSGTQVLKDINFELEEGKFYTLLGASGSGKSTILNIIAEKLNAKGLNFTGGEMFQTYVDYCKYETSLEIPDEVKIIKSDDVFDYIYNVKRINNRGFNQRESLLKEYFECKKTSIRDINDYQSIKMK